MSSPAPAIAQLLARLTQLGAELAPPTPGTPRRKFDLAHMRTLLEALGSPHRLFPSVLIAGTNGKGSTAATLASILQAAGHRVGLYTSPHLEQPNERIRIDGNPISDVALALHFARVEAVATRLVHFGQLPYPPSFFEAITAIAFLHFADLPPSEDLIPTVLQGSGQTTGAVSPDAQTDELRAAKAELAAIRAPKVDIAILEVGMGGRLDATNVVLPLISVITDISLDHTAWLGNTIAEITREKAGILRPRGLLVTLPQHPEANQTIGEIAVPLEVEATNAADYLPPRQAANPSPDPSAPPSGPSTHQSLLANLLRNRYDLTLPPHSLGATPDPATLHIDSPLAGSHQQRNLALAIATAVTLHRRHGYTLTAVAIEDGIRQTHWPARLQLLPSAPQDRGTHAPILLDAAHNPAGAWALRAALSPLPIPGSRTLIFGCMADKELAELTQVLFPVFDTVLLTQASGPRAATVEALLAAASRSGADCQTFASPTAALSSALASTPSNGLIVIAGSIALIGELIPHLTLGNERAANCSTWNIL